MIGNSVVNMIVKSRCPVMIINNTVKTIALKKGVIGKISPISEQNVVELTNSINNVINIKQDILHLLPFQLLPFYGGELYMLVELVNVGQYQFSFLQYLYDLIQNPLKQIYLYCC
jgi:hypothetical protein